MPKFIFNKLVRTKLHDEYARMGEVAEYRELSKKEFSEALVNKVVEEIKELPVEGTKEEVISELSDVKQALDDLMRVYDIAIDEVATAQEKKFQKKGGFSADNFVVSLELKDDDEWVEYYRQQPSVFQEVSDDSTPQLPLVAPGVYEHYKGKRYEVIGVGLDSESLKPVVVYVPLYDSETPFWVRPYEMFLEFVEVNGTKVRRFEKVGK